jgi:general secretion pathway protein F
MLYRYEAIDVEGRRANGTAEAGSPADARALLRDRGLLAYGVEEAVRANGPCRRASGDVTWFALSGRRLDHLTQATRQLALLLRAGIPLGQALGILAGQIEDRRFREIVEHVALRVREGTEFDEALGDHPRHFPELYIHVVRSGLQAGELPRVLLELSSYYVRLKKIRDRVVSALTYPALMSLIGIFVLAFLLAFVVPKVTAVLLEEKRVLPWPTEALLALSGAITAYGWVLLPAVGIMALILVRLVSTERGARIKDRLLMKIPVLGDLLRKQIVARWAGTMATLLASGIPVAQALGVVRGAVGSRILADDIARIEREVVEGANFSDAIKRSRILPASVGFVAGVGEESGALHEVLRDVADSYNDEVEVTAARLTELLNPILIVFLGLVVGFIVAAILLPITDFSNIQ